MFVYLSAAGPQFIMSARNNSTLLISHFNFVGKQTFQCGRKKLSESEGVRIEIQKKKKTEKNVKEKGNQSQNQSQAGRVKSTKLQDQDWGLWAWPDTREATFGSQVKANK